MSAEKRQKREKNGMAAASLTHKKKQRGATCSKTVAAQHRLPQRRLRRRESRGQRRSSLGKIRKKEKKSTTWVAMWASAPSNEKQNRGSILIKIYIYIYHS